MKYSHNFLQAKFIKIVLLILFMCLNTVVADVDDMVPQVAATAIAPPDPLFDKEVLRGIKYTFNDRYEEGIALFDSLIQIYPEQPAPYFFKAAAYQNWMSSFRFNQFQKELEENIQLAIQTGEVLLEKGPNAWVHFYIGAAYGYRGFHRFRKHNWIGAYKDGRRGVDNFKTAFKLDSTLYDVYLGLGTYHYWRTAKSKFLRLITFWMSDKRELGLEQIEFSIKHGRYAPNEAGYGLIISLFDYKKYDQAFNILEKLIAVKELPTLSDLYFKGRLMAVKENWLEVDLTFREILKRLQDYRYPSIGYQVESKYWIALALVYQQKKQEAFQLTVEALQQSNQREKESELEGPLEDFDEFRKLLEKLNKELNKELSSEK